MRRVASGSSANFLDPAAITQRVLECRSQRVGDKSECVEKIALAGAIGPDEERRRLEPHRAPPDTLVVLDLDAQHELTLHPPPLVTGGRPRPWPGPWRGRPPAGEA